MRCIGIRAVTLFVLTLGVAAAIAGTRCGKVEQVDALNECLGEQLRAEDKSLNAAYADLRRKLPTERQELLKNAEASWVLLRDKDCEFEASAAIGGTGYQSLYLSCQIHATKSRTRLLQNWRKPS